MHSGLVAGTVQVPGSKSISNRLLIIQALAKSHAPIANLSAADDTRTLQQLLQQNGGLLDVGPAGTTFRFLLAYCALTPGQWQLQGTPRLHERPIFALVEALRSLGAHIQAVGEGGRPPFHVQGKTLASNGKPLPLDASESSQFASALMLIAPYLPGGLTLALQGAIQSAAYLHITTALMQACGIEVHVEEGQRILIPEGHYVLPQDLAVEGDWSAAAVWFSMAAVAEGCTIHIPHLPLQSIQGDARLVELYKVFGVECIATQDGITIRNLDKTDRPTIFEADFTDTPDLVPYVLATCAALRIPAKLSGTQALIHKESNRLQAMQQELAKTGASLRYDNHGTCTLSYVGLIPGPYHFNTHDDHRIAMALSIFACKATISLQSPEVVSKSYPGFWQDMASLGFHITPRP